eukprot:TRINITY_DN14642_c1_g3_i2.p2 TRINITY_DN14642_c1_g3~~TRINITY_DN14642_c1_g3_i2.p2  ORF type:complete len:745 (+),score=328.92 TRINITY_DN14642_c1_g3_i2:91-2325(+)
MAKSRFGSLFEDSDEDSGARPPPVVVPKPPPGPPVDDSPVVPAVVPPPPAAQQQPAQQQPTPPASARSGKGDSARGSSAPGTPLSSSPRPPAQVAAAPAPGPAPQAPPPQVQPAAATTAEAPPAAPPPQPAPPPATPTAPAPVPAQAPAAQPPPQQQQPPQQRQQRQRHFDAQSTASTDDTSVAQQRDEGRPRGEPAAVAAAADPTPEKLPETFPDLGVFPAFAVVAPASREKAWADERERADNEAVRKELEERNRDSEVVQKLNCEQITALRREKDALRADIDTLQAQLSQREAELQQQHAREAHEMTEFKASFKKIMMQQSQQIEQLTAALREEHTKVESLTAIVNAKGDLIASRDRELQDAQLSLAGLGVEKGALEARLSMTHNQLDAAKSQIADLRRQLGESEEARNQLTLRCDDMLLQKDTHCAELRQKHDEHLDLMRQKFEQREAAFTTEYARQEQRLREDFLKFSEQLQQATEGMLGRFREEWRRDNEQRAEEHAAEIKRLGKAHRKELQRRDEEVTAAKQDYLERDAELRRWLKDQEAALAKREQSMRDAHAADRKQWGDHLEKEVQILDKRLKEAQGEVDRLVCQRDKDIAERIATLKQELAKTHAQSALDLKARTAELETHHRVREAQQEKRNAEERGQLMEMFKGELIRIGEEHRRAERELERLHRDNQQELQRRAKIITDTSKDGADRAADQEAGSKFRDELLGKFEHHRQSMRERHDSVRRSISETPGAIR